MKRINFYGMYAIVILVLFVIAQVGIHQASAMDRDVRVNCVQVFDSFAIADTTWHVDDTLVDLTDARGYFSYYQAVTGNDSATLTTEYLTSPDAAVSYVRPDAAQPIFEGFTTVSGNDSNGIDQKTFSPIVSRFMKFRTKVTNAVGSSNTVTSWACYQ